VAQDPDPFTVGPPVPGTALDPFGARPSSRRPDPDPWGGGLAAALPDPDPFAAPPLACPERPSDASLAGLLAQLALLQDAAPALEQAVQAHLATLQQALDEMQTALAFGPPPPVSDQSSGTFTATATGCSAGVTGTARWDKHGTSVLLYLPQLSGTSTSTAFTVTGIPAALEPTRAAYQLVRAVDNGAEVMGLLEAGVTPSTFTLYASSGGASWTASGAKILQACWVAYALL
jgi:hypothetical protein